jgi:hypothetical protein
MRSVCSRFSTPRSPGPSSGIDLTIKDYRWGSTAAGWARHALRDEKMAQWLEEAERLT